MGKPQSFSFEYVSLSFLLPQSLPPFEAVSFLFHRNLGLEHLRGFHFVKCFLKPVLSPLVNVVLSVHFKCVLWSCFKVIVESCGEKLGLITMQKIKLVNTFPVVYPLLLPQLHQGLWNHSYCRIQAEAFPLGTVCL